MAPERSLSWRIRPVVASHALMSSSASIVKPSTRKIQDIGHLPKHYSQSSYLAEVLVEEGLREEKKKGGGGNVKGEGEREEGEGDGGLDERRRELKGDFERKGATGTRRGIRYWSWV
jgi:hypothetical protein